MLMQTVPSSFVLSSLGVIPFSSSSFSSFAGVTAASRADRHSAGAAISRHAAQVSGRGGHSPRVPDLWMGQAQDQTGLLPQEAQDGEEGI